MAGHNNWPYIINLGNSIIGVAVLAMPFCFKQCGIILAMLVLLFCTWLTLASCQLLMKAGIVSRRRSYEFLAYFTHGATGKFLSEMGMIGMQVGTLIAQIVVIGDLGPAIIAKLFGLENTSTLRTWLIICLCLCVGLPLGLLKDLRAVSRASTVCITFYTIFILYIVFLSLPHLWSGSWYPHVHFWRPEGLFQCLPILSFSFGCQTQLFLLYDALPEPSLKAISSVISSAVNLCAVAYLVVGFFGYVTFYAKEIPGDILAIFPSTLFADVMKLCFVFSIVITFPVIIFPCRASIYTLLFSKKTKMHDDNIEGDVFMSEQLFKGITISIVLGSMITGILIPNVEFILGLNGAIVGTLICYIFPALFFLKVMGTKPEGKTIAQIVFALGFSIMLLSSYATLSSQDKGHSHIENPKELIIPAKVGDGIGLTQPPAAKPPDHPVVNSNQESPDDTVKKKEPDENVEDKRHEPPNPDPPDSVQDADSRRKKDTPDLKNANEKLDPGDEKTKVDKDKVQKESDPANKAKEQELEEKEKKQDELLQELEKHRDEQEKLLKEQRELLKELKDHQEEDHKEEDNEKQEKMEPADPLHNEIVNQQQKIINEQQKVIKQQQEQLNQQKNVNNPPVQGPGNLQQNNEPLSPNNQQAPQMNQQQPILPQGQLQGNQAAQVNQQQPVGNQAAQVNQQQPVGNQAAQGNQQQPVGNQPVQMNQQLPVGNQPVQMNQQLPVGNQPIQMNQQLPAGNQPVQMNQQLPVGNQPVQMNQQLPVGNQPVQMNQQPPQGNQPLQINKHLPVANQPVQVNQQPPQGNLPVQTNQRLPLVNQPAQMNLQQSAGNQPMQMNQQLPNGNQPIPMNQQQLTGNKLVQLNQQQRVGDKPGQVNQQQPLGNQQIQNQQNPVGNQPAQVNQQ